MQLQRPVSQMIYNPEVERYMLDGDDVYCGDSLSVLVYDGIAGKEVWIDTRMEMDGSGSYYLVGLLGYQIGGLFACRI